MSKIVKECVCCKTALTNKQSKYCSQTCKAKKEYGTFIEQWLSGADIKTSKGTTVSTRIRTYLFSLYNSKCAKCGWGEINPVTGKSPLEVEHIDGNSENNSPLNLTLLCPNCHSLTPTYKFLNKGNGRHSRMEKYREGKSY